MRAMRGNIPGSPEAHKTVSALDLLHLCRLAAGRAAEPGSRIIGEELSPELSIGGLVWIVDPLDGTTNFLHGFPSYAVSVAAAVDGVLEAGVVHHVPHNETYHATRSGGAWLGQRRPRLSALGEA